MNVKITVMRITKYEDLMAKYENDIENACALSVGDVFVTDGTHQPAGLCDSAWDTIAPFAASLSRGEGNFFDGWMKNPLSAMLSCNDGFRPVTFDLEAIEK